jgi:hypothetical protein
MKTGDLTGAIIESITGIADSGANLIGFLQENAIKSSAAYRKGIWKVFE